MTQINQQQHDCTTRIQTLVSTHRMHLGGLTTPVTIYLWRDDETGWLTATASHAILTPWQRSADVPQPSGYHQTPESALRSVVSGYKSCFMQALDLGHTPDQSWLVPDTL